LGVARRIVVISPGSVELGEESLDPSTIVEGTPRTRSGEIASTPLADGSTLETGVWSCSPGTVTDVETDETFVVLSGRAEIECDGETFEIGPGDVCVLPAGAETKWTVYETLTKVYVLVS
jgi:uncharacterized protein